MPLSEAERRWLDSHPEFTLQRTMKRRCEEHDYTAPCIYMITLAVEGKQPVLGKLCPADERHQFPFVRHSPVGAAVEQCWHEIPTIYPQVKPLRLQIMPDHLHGVLQVTASLPCHLGTIIAGFKMGCRKALRVLAASTCEAEPRTTPTTPMSAATVQPSVMEQLGQDCGKMDTTTASCAAQGNSRP